ncbi:MAG: xanthine dehydrogenase family protein molybdopterin-binding subunit [Acetobacteraceae bacterium]|nr:xanthine dehydrogenase family protein molybdopterin-binding subunit [Acetobacteraceae bacterium]
MIVGHPINRRDGRAKITGRARYAAEFPLEGLAHAVLVQSTIAAGGIVAFDTEEAEREPGVLAVITPENALRLRPEHAGPQAVTAPLLQNRDVLYNGQHVGLVVADTLDRALAAAGRVRLRYRQDEAVTLMDQALDAAVVPKNFRNGERPPDSRRGDPDGVFASAPVRLEATYTTPVEHHNPMEPHATIAAWDGDRLTVWTATQGISGAQAALAALFGLEPKAVRVICPFVGGGFGCKGSTWPPATLAAMAARMVGRPVKLVLTRAQMFTSNGFRPRTIQRIKLGAERSGRLLAMRHEGFSQMSQPVLGEFVEPVGLATEMLYACPNVAVSHRIVPVHQGLPTYMRAPGEASGVFALESAMDELAAALNIDPLELRLANYAETDPHEGKPFSSKKLRECYEQGAAAFGWNRRSPAPRSMRDGNWLVGFGMATATYPNNRRPASASVRLGADGIAVVRSGTQDLGTGTYTVMAQVAADALALPVSRVRFELGDSQLPKAPVSGGSSTVPSVSPAVAAACLALRSRLIDMAIADPRTGWSDLAPDALRFENGVVVGPDRRVSAGELLARRNLAFIEAEAESKPGAERKQYALHAFGAQFAEVRVDALTGEIRLARYVGAFDVGRVLNAKTARSQLIGGITFGVGMALFERTAVDSETGRIVNANIAEYLLAVNADIPPIQAILIPNDDRAGNPVGVKGMGELPIVGVAAAIANAVWHATGVRVRDLPIRIEDMIA